MVHHKVKVVGYCRVSTDTQVREGESLSEQKGAIEAYCKAKGLHLIEVIEDRGVSGREFRNRPGIMQVQRLAHRKGVGKVVACDMSRLGRSARQLLNALAYLEDGCGVQVVLLKEQIDTSTPAGRLQRNVLASVAEFEVDMIRERTSAGRRARQARGVLTSIGSGGVYGYDYVAGDEQGQGRTFTINREQAEVLREVAAWILDEGLSLRKSVERMAERGFKTRWGRARWTVRGLREVLSHPMMYGEWVSRFRWESATSPDTGNTYNRRVLLPKAEWKTVMRIEGETVFSRATFDRLQPCLGDVHKPKPRFGIGTPLLSGLLYCGTCATENEDGTLTMARFTSRRGAPKREGGRYPPKYICYWSNRPKEVKALGRKPCNSPRLPAGEVEEIVWCFVKRCVLSPDVFIDNLLNESSLEGQRDKLKAKLAKAAKQVARIDAKQQVLLTRLAEVKVPRLTQQALIDLEHERVSIGQRQVNLQARLDQVEAALTAHKVIQRTAKGMSKAVSAKVEKALDAAPVDEKRRLIHAVCGGGKLVVTRVTARMLKRLKKHADYYRVTGIVGKGPLAEHLSTLSDAARPLRDKRFKDETKGRDGWRVSLVGTIDAAYVANRLAEIGQQYAPAALGKSYHSGPLNIHTDTGSGRPRA